MSDHTKVTNITTIGHMECNHCEIPATTEGHDGCLGTLPCNVKNACCGHGNPELAYIQFSNSDIGDSDIKVTIKKRIFQISDVADFDWLWNRGFGYGYG
jgi:hypothetical protein